MDPKKIASKITENPDITCEDYCPACGGWDKEQGGSGHKGMCPVGAKGLRIEGGQTPRKLLVRIDGITYKTLIDPNRWKKSTKPYLTDCGRNIEELGEFDGDHEVTDDDLSDIIEPRDGFDSDHEVTDDDLSEEEGLTA